MSVSRMEGTGRDSPLGAGEFATLAEQYAKHRPDYSGSVLRALLGYVGADRLGFQVADVGAGTGIWTRMLAEHGLNCVAVEPDESMRGHGARCTAGLPVAWHAGSAEATGLDSASVGWVTMASSFHWARLPDALQEFRRILKPDGFLTVLWNPREIEGHPLFERIENLVYEKVPGLRRRSSGSVRHAPDYETELQSTGDFRDVIFFEAKHEVVMSKDRYLGVWRSVNDIQRQAGPDRFEELLHAIGEMVEPFDELVVPYRTRAWTARLVSARR